MTSRERVIAALQYKPVDKVPLQYYYAPVGYYEHGEKLNDLFASLPGDFEPFVRISLPAVTTDLYNNNGEYHEYKRDEWGTLWEYRILGVQGLPVEYPLSDIQKLDQYVIPKPVSRTSPENICLKKRVAGHKEQYYCMLGVGSLFEHMKRLRSDIDVLCDIAMDTPEINKLADLIMLYHSHALFEAIDSGADCISFGDDYGTERGMLMNPELWRAFFKPRLKAFFKPAIDAGLDVIFHSCGKIDPILEDLRETGVTAIWPQLPAYDMKELASQCKSIGLAVAIHTDRAHTMTHGSPIEVQDLVEREFETFHMMDGGSWFYIEVDNGFPYENIISLVQTIAKWR